MMNDRVLCVDDEPKILKVYQAQLKSFDVTVAEGGEAGLAAVKEKGPFAVIVSDLRMPGMSGAQFLSRAREISPDTVRMLMTGETDLMATLEAINEGNLFRFLVKPCAAASFQQAIRAGIEQHRLIRSEKDLLELTLYGSVEVMAEILSLASPLAFGKAIRIQKLVQQLGAILKFPTPWVLEVAALLSQIGCVTIPEPLLSKLYSGEALSKKERLIVETHPKIGRDLISKIPRLEEVAEIILHQTRRCDGSDAVDCEKSPEIPLGSRILKIAIDYEEQKSLGFSRSRAIDSLIEHQGWYCPEALEALKQLNSSQGESASEVILVRHLQVDMILAEDLNSKAGALLAPKGQRISEALLRRLLNNAENGNVCDQIEVRVPATLSIFAP